MNKTIFRRQGARYEKSKKNGDISQCTEDDTKNIHSTMQKLTTLLVPVILLLSIPGKAQNTRDISANDRMLLSNEQTKRLEKRQGTWDVVMEFQPSPDAPVITVKGITAKRTMMGQYLQEIMEPDANSPKFTRISYTVYNQADSRWENVSIDTRISSIMNRENFGDDQPDLSGFS